MHRRNYLKFSLIGKLALSASPVLGSSKKQTVVLDPGHGMGNRRQGVYDPGCVFGQYQEAEMVLDQAKSVERKLSSLGYEVYLTRVNQTQNVPLGKRLELAKAVNADALVSLHINSFTNPEAKGFETFYEAENGIDLAKSIQNMLHYKVHKWSPTRGVKQRSLAVLDESIPSVLVEPGFLSNARDRNMLVKYPEIYADAITRGIDNYFQGGEK